MMKRLTIAALALAAGTAAAAAQDFPEVFPTPHEPTRSESRLSAPPGTIPGEAPRGGITFDLFGGPVQAQSRCEEIYENVNGVRTLVSVRCSD